MDLKIKSHIEQSIADHGQIQKIKSHVGQSMADHGHIQLNNGSQQHHQLTQHLPMYLGSNSRQQNLQQFASATQHLAFSSVNPYPLASLAPFRISNSLQQTTSLAVHSQAPQQIFQPPTDIVVDINSILSSKMLPQPLLQLPEDVRIALREHFRHLSPPPTCPRCNAGPQFTRFRYLNNCMKSLKLQPMFVCSNCSRNFSMDGQVRLNERRPRKREGAGELATKTKKKRKADKDIAQGNVCGDGNGNMGNDKSNSDHSNDNYMNVNRYNIDGMQDVYLSNSNGNHILEYKSCSENHENGNNNIGLLQYDDSNGNYSDDMQYTDSNHGLRYVYSNGSKCDNLDNGGSDGSNGIYNIDDINDNQKLCVVNNHCDPDLLPINSSYWHDFPEEDHDFVKDVLSCVPELPDDKLHLLAPVINASGEAPDRFPL